MKRALILALLAPLYGGAALADNTSPSMLSEEAREAFVEALPDDLENFVLHDEPRPFRDAKFYRPDGRKKIDLKAFEGKVTVLNFWATWCPPCLKELPSLDRLHTELEEKGVEVVTISLDRKKTKQIEAFLEKRDFENLQSYHAPKSGIAKQMGVLGLPVTAILGPDAREIGRFRGDAEWDSPEVIEVLELLLEETGVSEPAES